MVIDARRSAYQEFQMAQQIGGNIGAALGIRKKKKLEEAVSAELTRRLHFAELTEMTPEKKRRFVLGIKDIDKTKWGDWLMAQEMEQAFTPGYGPPTAAGEGGVFAPGTVTQRGPQGRITVLQQPEMPESPYGKAPWWAEGLSPEQEQRAGLQAAGLAEPRTKRSAEDVRQEFYNISAAVREGRLTPETGRMMSQRLQQQYPQAFPGIAERGGPLDLQLPQAEQAREPLYEVLTPEGGKMRVPYSEAIRKPSAERQTEPLVEVVDPATGGKKYVPRSQAAGMPSERPPTLTPYQQMQGRKSVLLDRRKSLTDRLATYGVDAAEQTDILKQIQKIDKELDRIPQIQTQQQQPTPEDLRRQNTREAYETGKRLGYWQ